MPSQQKVDSREFITRLQTSGDRIPSCGEPMVGIIVLFAPCTSANTKCLVSTLLYQLVIMAGETAASRASFAEENFMRLKVPEQSEADKEVFFPP